MTDLHLIVLVVKVDYIVFLLNCITPYSSNNLL